MKREHVNEIKALIIVAIGMIFLASLISFVPEDLPWYTSRPNVPPQNLIRITGAYIAGVSFFIFGYGSYCLVFLLFFLSWLQFSSKEFKLNIYKFFSFMILISVLSGVLSLVGTQMSSDRFQRAGIVGLMISDFLVKYLGRTGAYITLLTLSLLALILTGEMLVSPLFFKIVSFFQWFFGIFLSRVRTVDFHKSLTKEKKLLKEMLIEKRLKTASQQTKEKGDALPTKVEQKKEPIIKEKPELTVKPQIRIAPVNQEKIETPKDHLPELKGEYKLPPLELLEDSPVISTNKIESGLMGGAKVLEETLAQFGVDARVVDIERGPAITRYELEPGPGVKVQKFTSLSNDIALSMKATVVRVVAPIPGKNRVGIEVPNEASASVYLKDVLSTSQFRNSKSKLTLSLGKDLAGKALIADLADMPHLMIAGTTGSGKTVCVNGIIMSILLRAKPDEVKFVVIDPKMVELAQYADIPHLLCPPVTDVRKAAGVLNWVVSEMENRYKILSGGGVRNIQSFNDQGNKMPYIVVVIDELADLMQVSAKTVESSLTRLAQLSRAVGIHLVLATQRPSVDVITGVIKANFPARISFKVASKVDSRTVLDMNGAESLLGKGDMLFLRPGEAKLIRGQCSFVKDEEIHRIIQFIKDQQGPVYDESILQHQKAGGPMGAEGKDEYYDEAVRLVIETNQASVSILQRRMRLGYTRAARLIDMMEQNGIVGPYCGSKPREILLDRERWLLDNMKQEDTKTNE